MDFLKDTLKYSAFASSAILGAYDLYGYYKDEYKPSYPAMAGRGTKRGRASAGKFARSTRRRTNTTRRGVRRKPYKPRRYRRVKRRGGTGRGAISRLARQLRTLRSRVESGLTTLTYKRRVFSRAIAAANAVEHHLVDIQTKDLLFAALNAMPVYDEDAPATIGSADFTTPTYQREVNFARAQHYLLCKNNYTTPVHVTIYHVIPKSDTSIDPIDAMDTSLAKQDEINGSTISSNTPMIYPTDAAQFNDLWRIIGTKKAVLLAGQQLMMAATYKPFTYDISFAKAHNLQYLAQYRGSAFVVRVAGVLGHDDTTAGLFGTTQSGVDCVIHTKYVIKYDGGVDTRQLRIVDGSNNTSTVNVSSYSDCVQEQFTPL